MSPRRSGRTHAEPAAEAQESTRRRLEEARKVVESKLAWLERAENLARLSDDVKELGKQLSRLESMVMGLYAALEPRQTTQSVRTGNSTGTASAPRRPPSSSASPRRLWRSGGSPAKGPSSSRTGQDRCSIGSVMSGRGLTRTSCPTPPSTTSGKTAGAGSPRGRDPARSKPR